MKMDLNLFVMAVLLNSSLCIMQYMFQGIDRIRGIIPPHRSKIPGTKQFFLQWEDFYTQTYGDFLGLIWVMFVFLHLLVDGHFEYWLLAVFFAVFMVTVLFFLKSCRAKDHKPDWGFPTIGRISLGGFSHLPYLGLNAAMVVICIIKSITGELNGLLFWTFVIGAGFWCLTFVADLSSGHFDKLKTI